VITSSVHASQTLGKDNRTKPLKKGCFYRRFTTSIGRDDWFRVVELNFPQRNSSVWHWGRECRLQ